MPARARALAVAFLATAAVLLATAASAHVTNRGRNDPIASHFHKATGTRILTVRPNGKAPRQITPVPELPGVFQCWDENPCQLDAGTYLLSLGEVIPGLRLTLPAGWSSTSNWVGELVLVPPGHSDDRLFLWVDEAAVKSTGPGHGTTILNDVGTSPEALTEWLTGNPDFHIVTGPERTTIGDRIPVRTLSLNSPRQPTTAIPIAHRTRAARTCSPDRNSGATPTQSAAPKRSASTSARFSSAASATPLW